MPDILSAEITDSFGFRGGFETAAVHWLPIAAVVFPVAIGGRPGTHERHIMSRREPVNSIKPLVNALVNFNYRLECGAETAGLYWPALFQRLGALERAVQEDNLPACISDKTRESVKDIREWIRLLNMMFLTVDSFHAAPVPLRQQEVFQDLNTRFYRSLPEGTFATKKSRDLDDLTKSPVLKPKIYDEQDDRPPEYKHGPIEESREALGYALHTERDTLSPNSLKCLHDMFSQKSNVKNSIFWAQRGPAKKLLVYFKSEEKLLEIKDLASKYPGRRRKKAP